MGTNGIKKSTCRLKRKKKKNSRAEGPEVRNVFSLAKFQPCGQIFLILKAKFCLRISDFPLSCKETQEESTNTFYLQSEQRIFQMARWHHTSSRAEA